MAIPTLINFAAFQVGWFACVLGAGRGWYLLGPIFVAVWALLHLGLMLRISSRRASGELALMLAAGAIGTGLDILHAKLGVARFQGEPSVLGLCPLWMTALWINFATTLNHSLAWLHGRYTWTALLGAIGGPMVYFGGWRLGALSIEGSLFYSLGILAITWGAVTPLLFCLAKHLSRNAPPVGKEQRVLRDVKCET